MLEDPQKLCNPADNDPEEVFYIEDDSVDPIGDVERHIELCINGEISIQVELEYDSEITGSCMKVNEEAILKESDYETG